VTPAQARTLAAIEAELARLIRHDDESVVHETWIRQRYDLGSSASIRHGSGTQGRVHGIQGGGEQAFVIDAAGQIAERLRDWSMPASDDELRAWLPTWRADGGDARRFRRDIAARFGGDEVAAWRHCEQALTPQRPRIRQVARALLVHPRHLPYDVVAAVAARV
jgi:hypothetical protein